jgi:hypothetical protein
MQDIISKYSGLPLSPMSIEDKFTYRQLLGLQKIETEKGAKKD